MLSNGRMIWEWWLQRLYKEMAIVYFKALSHYPEIRLLGLGNRTPQNYPPSCSRLMQIIVVLSQGYFDILRLAIVKGSYYLS
jgi:hypothetical protein